MKSVEYNSIDNVNDRTILVLLKYKKEKTRKERKLFEKLSKTYVDNFNFEFSIISKLEELGYMSVTNNEIRRDEYGRPILLHPDLPHEHYTTELFNWATIFVKFPSETRKKTFDKRFRYWQLIGIIIAAIGGLITICNFLLKLFQSSF